MSLPPPESLEDRLFLMEARLVAIEAALAALIRTAPADGRLQALFALSMLIRASAARPGLPGQATQLQAVASLLAEKACGPEWQTVLPVP